MTDGQQISTGPGSDEVRAAVEKITASSLFARSERLERFLRFIVERTLEGRSGEIKESVLAVEVFDRAPGFNPGESTIVRTEARRLRQRLEHYYDGEGRADPTRITLPKGTYVPIFLTSAGKGRSRLWKYGLPAWCRLALALALLCAGAFLAWHGWWRYGPIFPAEEVKLVVFPFRDLSRGSGEAYFAYGMREELVGDLRMISRIRLIEARGPSREASAAEIGRDLGASHVVQGSVQRSTNNVRIDVRVTASSSGRVVWEVQTAGGVSAAAQICGTLALGIARRTGIRVGGEERRRLTEKIPIPTDAVLHFWQGLHSYSRYDSANIANAIGHLERAVKLDRRIDWAWATLALSYHELASRGRMPAIEAAVKADDAAGRAMAMNQAAHRGTRGIVSGMLQWQWSAAGLELRRHVELNPNSAWAHASYANFYLRPMGRTAEALAAIDKALAYDPSNRGMHTTRASILIESGRTREGIAELDKLVRPGPPFGQVHIVQARAKALEGDYEGALAVFEATNHYLDAAWVLALAGRRADAIREMEEAPPTDTLGLLHLRAAVHAALGDDRAALEHLENAAGEHEVQLAYLKMDPRFARLRPHPRFQALLRKIGLSERERSR